MEFASSPASSLPPRYTSLRKSVSDPIDALIGWLVLAPACRPHRRLVQAVTWTHKNVLLACGTIDWDLFTNDLVLYSSVAAVPQRLHHKWLQGPVARARNRTLILDFNAKDRLNDTAEPHVKVDFHQKRPITIFRILLNKILLNSH